jgi:hypothetical protein
VTAPFAFVTAFAKDIFVALQVATIRYCFPLDVGNGLNNQRLIFGTVSLRLKVLVVAVRCFYLEVF